MKVWRNTLRWAGLKVQNGSKNERVRDDVKKKKCEWSKTANEEQQQQQNKDQYHKNFRREPKQAPSLGVFDYFMVINDYLWLMKIIIYDYCDYLWLLIIICNYKMIIYGY